MYIKHKYNMHLYKFYIRFMFIYVKRERDRYKEKRSNRYLLLRNVFTKYNIIKILHC